MPLPQARTTYEARGWSRFSEEDVFEGGCQPDSGVSNGGDETFTGETLREAVEQCASFAGLTGEKDIRECCDLDACGEVGRLDVAVMETADGERALPEHIAEWKAKRLRLWYVTYTFRIQHVQRQPALLEGALS